MCTRFDWSRTAVSSSIAEKRKPQSPEINKTFSAGRTSVAAMAHGRAIKDQSPAAPVETEQLDLVKFSFTKTTLATRPSMRSTGLLIS
jgi:hypothetical protein